MLVLSVLGVPFTLTHAVEDFAAGVPAARFGLALLPAAFLLSLDCTTQVAAATLSAHGDVRGDALNLPLALVWLVARPPITGARSCSSPRAPIGLARLEGARGRGSC